MNSTPITVVDYKSGNLTSVALALEHLGYAPHVTGRAEDVAGADRVVFPGVGAAGSAMKNLTAGGLDAALREVHARGRPILGICIGCQVIFEQSEEDGDTTCLGLLSGSVHRFQFPEGVSRKVPHMGWNEVHFLREHPVLTGLPSGSQFYFVHSYHPAEVSPSIVYGEAIYGEVRFPVALAKDNLMAVQFHPEKSGKPGLQLLDNFLRWRP